MISVFLQRKKTNKVINYKMISVFITLVILALSLYTHAEVYYVDKNHPQASDNNPGTETEPFETVQRGIIMAGSRDTVYIKKG